MFRVDELIRVYYIGLGVATSATSGNGIPGYAYCSHGWFARPVTLGTTLEGYTKGDIVAVRLDLDANTVAFRKNGKEVTPPEKILPHGAAYRFAFVAYCEGDAVTIVEGEMV